MSTQLMNRSAGKSAQGENWLQRRARQAVMARLAGVEHGELTVREGHNSITFGVRDAICDIAVTLDVLDADFFIEVALGGSVGGAEAYMRRAWECDDLVALIRLLIKNRHVLDAMETGMARAKAPVRRLAHWMNRNHMDNSRRNIRAHYDLGNDFFGLFLDPTMMYSSAIFPSPGASLEAASNFKLERICRKLELCETDRVVEIGTGWGGFAEYAATHFGCHITTTTISDRQLAFARQRIGEAGLGDRVTLLGKDYRVLDGQYDKLVSIEMIEAVGHNHFDTFFRKCSDLLRPDGMMFLQSITIADQQYEQSRKTVDFIQKYIFPGGALPSLSALAHSLGSVTDLSIVEVTDIGPHYAETLRRWRSGFFDNISAVREKGFPEEFIRMWDYYFCYCEAGFEERVLGDLQLVMHKPRCRALGIGR